jgi:hypothetical protein
MSFLLPLIFFLQQNWRTREWNRFCLEAGQGEGLGGRRGEKTQTMYTYVSKCKTAKIKERKK